MAQKNQSADCDRDNGTIDYHCVGLDLHPSFPLQQVIAVLPTGD